jgi:hypothetical protein
VEELVEGVPRRDEKTGLYEGGVGFTAEGIREFKLPWEAKHNPAITIWCVFIVIYFIFEFEPQSEIALRRPLPTILAAIPQTIRYGRYTPHFPYRAHIHAGLPWLNTLLKPSTYFSPTAGRNDKRTN